MSTLAQEGPLSLLLLHLEINKGLAMPFPALTVARGQTGSAKNLHSHGVLRQEPMWWPLPSPTPQRQVPPVEPRQLLPLSLPCTVQWGLHLPSSPILGPTFLSRSVSPQIFALHTFLTLSFPFPNHCLPRPQQPCRTPAGFVPHPQSPNTN